MATEPSKIVYGGSMMLLVGGLALAFSTSAKLETKLNTREISSKDSGFWKEKLAGRLEWSASSDALYTETLTAGAAVPSAVNMSITSGAAVLTAASASFTASDVGRIVTITGAGVAAADLVTTILTFTSTTSVTLANNAGTTLATQPNLIWGPGVKSFDVLYSAMIARTPIACVMGIVKGEAPNFVLDATATRKNFAGSVLITSLSMNAPDGESTTYSVSLEGTGALVMA